MGHWEKCSLHKLEELGSILIPHNKLGVEGCSCNSILGNKAGKLLELTGKMDWWDL